MNVCMCLNRADYNMQFYTKWLFSFIYGDPCIWPDLVLEAVVVGRIFERLQQTPIISNLNEWRESAVRHKSPGEKHRCIAERSSWCVAHDFVILKKHFNGKIGGRLHRFWMVEVLILNGYIHVCYLQQVVLPDADGHIHQPTWTGLMRWSSISLVVKSVVGWNSDRPAHWWHLGLNSATYTPSFPLCLSFAGLSFCYSWGAGRGGYTTHITDPAESFVSVSNPSSLAEITWFTLAPTVHRP